MPRKKVENKPKAAEEVKEVAEEKQEIAEEAAEEVVEKPKKAKKVKPAKEPIGIVAKRLPDIRSGVCEFCGISYKECEHYKGIDIFCSYCRRKDTIPSRILKLFEIGDEIIVVCDDFKCLDDHNKKYR